MNEDELSIIICIVSFLLGFLVVGPLINKLLNPKDEE